MFTENIFGSKTKVKILRVLSELRTAYSLKSLVEETGLSLSISHKAAEELVEESVLTKLKGTRKERLYKFNSDSDFAFAIFEIFKIEKTKQRRDVILLKTWNILENLLTKTKEDINLLILFGSQAKGNATLRSDIDLLIIPKDDDTNLLEIIKNIDKKINPIFLNMKTFKANIKDKTPLYNNFKKDSVILFIRKNAKKDLKEFLEEHKGIWLTKNLKINVWKREP